MDNAISEPPLVALTSHSGPRLSVTAGVRRARHVPSSACPAVGRRRLARLGAVRAGQRRLAGVLVAGLALPFVGRLGLAAAHRVRRLREDPRRPPAAAAARSSRSCSPPTAAGWRRSTPRTASSCRIDDITPLLQQAVVAVEDSRFYEHDGVDLRGTAARPRDEQPVRPDPAGWLDAHHAVRQERCCSPRRPPTRSGPRRTRRA